MKRASISEVKNHLSAYVDLVRNGETVLLTDRNRPVARIVPLELGNVADEARLAELERSGVLRRAMKPPLKVLPTPVKLPAGVSVLEALLEERRGGR
jgi:prevent-host-death family protein